MTRQQGSARVSSGSPLRQAAVANGHRSWLIAGVVALHIAAVAIGLWSLPRSVQTPSSLPIVVQIASLPSAQPHPVQPAEPSPPSAVSPPAPVKLPPRPSKPTVEPRHPAATRNARQAKPAEASAVSPPSGDMLGAALSDIHQQGWQQTSQRYAEDSTGGVQSALARYRQGWVRAVQTYIDLHFPKTRRDARLEFSVTVDRYGKLVGLDMVHSTGDAALDTQAFNAIRAAAPFRPFDAGMGNRQTLTFRQGWVFNQGALLEP